MNSYWHLGLIAGLLFAAPVYADEAPPEDDADTATEAAAPAEEAAPEAVQAEAAPAETASTEPPPEDAPPEAAPSEEAPAEETPSEEAKPWKFYVGVAHDNVKLIVSDPQLKARFGNQDELKSAMNRVRVGVRLFDVVGVELHAGENDQDAAEPRSAEMNSYQGIFLVPTGSVFEILEISAVLGYAKFDMTRGAASQDFSGPAYGVNIEIPFKTLYEALPNFRIGGGYMVHSSENNARVSGGLFSLRYDF